MRWVRRHPLKSALGALAAALVVAALVLWRIAATSDPVTESEALATFRAGPHGEIAEGPRPGIYVYAATGSETGEAGPLSVTRGVPPKALMVVTPRDLGWEAELSYSRQHVEAVRYLLRDGAFRVTWRRTKVTFAGFGRDDRRIVEPPSLFVPVRVRVGARWQETYRTGDLTVRAESRVVRTEIVPVGTMRVRAFVLDIRSVTEGPHPGTRDETLWWSPDLRLPVRWDIDMEIGGTFAFRMKTRLRLTSATPRI